MHRLQTKQINVGGVLVGGASPVSVQSMCNTKTHDIDATLAQIDALSKAGCDIVRIAVPDEKAAKALKEIRRGCKIPLVADIHFDYKLAIRAIDAGFNKIRINPGNISDKENIKLLAGICKANGVPIRIGVNAGSLEKDLKEKYGPTPKGLCKSAMRHIRLLNDADFDDICISIKSSDVAVSVAAYKEMAKKTSYPLHLGITESGTAYTGLVKSAAGIGALLLDGIGNTIRVSLTADPIEEVKAGIAILKATGLRKEGADIISCPSCGRTEIDLISMTLRLEEILKDSKEHITVAVMGCSVNGPGEASHADYGIAGGKGEGLLFKKGAVVGKAPEEKLLEALVQLIEEDRLVN